MIREAKRFAKSNDIATTRFEFQMLYGVRRDLQDQLVRKGYRMRVYMPFGTQWYPYLMRRLAERPANVAFLTGNVFKEMVGRRRQLAMGQVHPTGPSKGDPNTIGGYMAVHDRPAAFEGSDGASYSVEIVTDESGDEAKPFAAYLLFVRWGPRRSGRQRTLETDFLSCRSEDEARKSVGALRSAM